MTGFRFLRFIAPAVATVCMLNSCSLRLPVQDQVIHTRVSSNAQSASAVPRKQSAEEE